ncbi:MAG: GTPase domain-containing protein [Candidatus Omnitrophota bacterium]
MKIEFLRRQLEELNRDLAALTGMTPDALVFQSGEAEEDTLFLYGIMGGKDVGKTTLINQLAGSRISIDTDLLDEGTKTAVAYCHEKDQPTLRKRLMGEAGGRVLYAPHNRDELRNVVLLDFPDFDSRFETHRSDVRSLSRHLQGIVWIVTPRKYGDHEFADRLESIAQSNENYYIVLNKMDQLDGAADSETVRREIGNYLEKECRKRRLAPPEQDRLLLISAREPNRFDYNALYTRLIRRHSIEEILKAKAKNIQAEFDKNLARLSGRYALTEKIEEIDRHLENLQKTIGEQFGDEYCRTVLQRIQILEQMRRRISTNLFYRRIESWPILRHLCYPLAGIVSLAGRSLGSAPAGDGGAETPRDLLRFEGTTASARMQEIHLALRENLSISLGRMKAAHDYAQQVDREFGRLLNAYEEKVVQRAAAGISAPKGWKRFGVYFPLLWFPVLQPVLLHMAQREQHFFSLAGIGDMIAMAISLAGAGALLESAVFLLVFYTVWLIILFANGTRRVLREGAEEFGDSWFEEFIPWIAAELSRPLQEMRARWMELRMRLDHIRKEIDEEMLRIANS